jgi:hypothetical protein
MNVMPCTEAGQTQEECLGGGRVGRGCRQSSLCDIFKTKISTYLLYSVIHRWYKL